MTTMSQADFARRHAVSRKTVTMWKSSGLIVCTEDGVDVEASDARLATYRDSHDGRAQRGPARNSRHGVTRVTQAPGNKAGAAPTTGRVTLTVTEIERRLRALDWTMPFDWSAEAQAARARQAAECLGWQAVTSDLLDDGHWGAYQLRDPRWFRDGELNEDGVIAGHGFEASAVEILQVCRDEITPDDEDDGDALYTVDPSLLPLLAHPHHEHDHPA